MHDGQTPSVWSRLSNGECSRSLVVCSGATLQTVPCCCILYRKKRLSPDNPSKPVILVQSLTILSWILTFSMLACRVRDVAIVFFFQFLWALHCLTLALIHWDIHFWEDWQVSLPLVSNLSYYRKMDFRLFGNIPTILLRLQQLLL